MWVHNDRITLKITYLSISNVFLFILQVLAEAEIREDVWEKFRTKFVEQLDRPEAPDDFKNGWAAYIAEEYDGKEELLDDFEDDDMMEHDEWMDLAAGYS